MQTAARLAGYGAALVLVFGGAWGLGATVDGAGQQPSVPPPAAPMHSAGGTGGMDDMDDMDGMDGMDDMDDMADMSGNQGGYELVQTAAPHKDELAVTIVGPDGRPVQMPTSADPYHDPYLAVIRHDGTGYQRLSPVVDGPGWRAPLTLNRPGLYRVLARYTLPDGRSSMLGTDVFAPGAVTPLRLTPTRVWQADGYQVRLDGDLVPGAASQVFATISKDGRPVTDIEPYAGSFGELTVLRATDLASVPVRSETTPSAPTDRSGPGIAFVVDVPTPGVYRLFLEYDSGGRTRSAEFTVTTRGTS